MTNKVYLITKSNSANGLAMIVLAAYLIAVVWRGNLQFFLKTLWQDISGKQTSGRAFWQWGLAVVVLYYLATNDTTEEFFGPFLAIMVVALLIQLAGAQPQLFNNLSTALNKVFGGS